MTELTVQTNPKPTPRLAGLIWGNAKVGKTTYAASSPGKKYIINLDPEGYIAVDHRDDVEVWDYSDQEPKRVIDFFTTKLGTRIDQSDAKPGDTFIFDSITVMNQHGLMTAIANGVGESRSFKPSIEMPGLAAYGARTQYLIHSMQPVLRATRRKGCNIWFIAHEDTPERNDKGDFLYQSILMSDNAINQTSAAISEIWRMSVGTSNNREVFIRQTNLYKPMGSRIFRMDEGSSFKLKYDIDKPDLDQPHSIASLWQKYLDGNGQKLHAPNDK